MNIHRHFCWFATLLVLVTNPTSLSAFQTPGHDELPGFDARRTAPIALPPAALAKLQRQVPGLRIETDGLRGTPKHIVADRGFLTGPNGEGRAVPAGRLRALPVNDPHRSIKAFVEEHAGLFGQGAELLRDARLRKDFVSRRNGVRTVVWEQRLDDLAVYEGVLLGHLTSQGELITLSSQFIPEAARAADLGTPNRAAAQQAPSLSAVEAVLLSAENIGEALLAAEVRPLLAAPQGRELRQTFQAGTLPGEAQARLIWLPLDGTSLRLCWEVELTRPAGGERHRVLVDAASGEVFLRQCLTIYLQPASYRVFTGDSPTPLSPGWQVPDSNQPPAVARSFVTVSALNTNASPIGWISDGGNETLGNNVDAHADRNGDDAADLPRPQGSPFRVFDAPLDLTQAPASYSDAAAVQLFYWCNWVHDRLHELGFDEASGNFQKDNFGRGGMGNDAIQADAQDGSGVNNANFTPSPDGVPGRIQMFVWTGPNPDSDGDFDAEVVIHEYVHGLSTRLVGGGVGIGSSQGQGMGEGWSDFYALALLSEPSDDLDATYAFGAYVARDYPGLTENYYFGIRRYPYSTDLSRSPLTFKDIDPAQISEHIGVPISPLFGFNPFNAGEVHAQGEVWCAMLWQARANLIRKHGYAAGNQLILQLVTDGMKLSPPNPTFTQARDAIILADQVGTQGANYSELWAAFAKRGLGFSAVANESTTTSGVVEAFDLPDPLFVQNRSGFVASGPLGGPFLPACVTYPLTNLSDQPLAWTARHREAWLTISPDGGTLAPGAATNVLVCLSSSATALSLGSFQDTVAFSNAVSGLVQTRPVEVRILAFTTLPFTEDFESGVLQPYWSLTGTGTPVTQITPLNVPHGGSNHLTLESLGGIKSRNEFSLGLDLAGYTNVVLKFWVKTFGDEPDAPPPSPFLYGADFDGVAISEDGIAWYEVQSLRFLPLTYKEFTVDLDAALAAHGLRYNSTFRLRFNQIDEFQIPFDGLGLDDISINGIGARRLTIDAPSRVTEGAGLLAQGFVSVGAPVSAAVTVTLTSSDPARLSVPPTVTIAAGSDRAAFGLTVLDNALLEGTVAATLRAEASQFHGDSHVIAITDNEPAFLRVILPLQATEGGDGTPSRGLVRVSTRPARDVVVELISETPDELQVPPTMTIPAGRLFGVFDLLPVDDHRLDGPQAGTVSARVAGWLADSESMVILDNDVPALFVQLPVSTSENNSAQTNAGIVRLSGFLPTNLVVHLASSDHTELLVPATVEVPAGELEAVFDLLPVDDALIDGRQAVTVSAAAPGFATGATTLINFDDETPPVPLNPEPADGATNVAVGLTLAWNPGLGNILRNGGFETGDFTGWTRVNGGYGDWVINNGSFDPDGPEGTNAPLSGRFNAMTAQIGAGQHLLYQEVFIPADALDVTWLWSDRIRNHTPYFGPRQNFRAEVRTTNDTVLALAFTTELGDPLLNDWTQRRFDLTRFRGQTVRLAFYQEDSTGYLNVLLDDISVELSEPTTPTTYDVYFGLTPTPGAAELRGRATNAFWPLPALALNTTYYWQIISWRGGASTAGPVWRFTTRGVGAVRRFEWGQIGSPQFVNERFAVTVTAKDDINNTVKDFTGSVLVTAQPGSGTRSGVVISELDAATLDRTEFANVSGAAVDLSGWKISVYDNVSWPQPLVTIAVPAGTICPPGGVFQLNENGSAPGQFPSFNTGTNVVWNFAPLNNPIAVLLQDAGGDVVDFVCAGNADPSLITAPRRIPADEWSGPPVLPTLGLITLSMQRTGQSDHHDRSDWTVASTTFGMLNPGLAPPFLRPTLALTPTVLTNFITGVWAGYLTVNDPAPRVTLRADDGDGHFGVANEFAVGVMNDLSVTVADAPDVVILGEPLTYQITVTNSGPNPATGVVLTNQLPPGVSFLSSATFDGACQHAGGVVICQLDPLFSGNGAHITITTRALTAGLVTNVTAVARAEADGDTRNNFAFTLTTVTGPSISTTNITLAEGNSLTNMAVIPVSLNVTCSVPVSVNYATSNNTAFAGEDFVAVTGTLVFAPGMTQMNILVPIIGDRLDENSELFAVNLFSPTNGVIALAQSRVRINDDDATPSLSINDVTLTEGPPGTTNFAVLNVTLSAPSGLASGAAFTTESRTAAAPSDYATTFGTVSFAPNETNQIIRVPIFGDARFEGTETLVVTLSTPLSASISRSTGTITVLDDDDRELDHFDWSEVPSPQYAGVPFFATLTARDGLNRTATGFHGPVNVRAAANSRAVTIGAGTNTWEQPLGTLFHDARTQVIYLPEELGSAGRLTGLSLQVTNVPGQTLSNWTIRLKHTALTSYAQAKWEAGGWTTVYQNHETVLAPGWVTFLFSEPFTYNGTNSLLVDFSFNNQSYSMNGLVRSTVTPQRRSLYFQTDSAFGDPLLWAGTNAPPPLLLERMPNLRLTFEDSISLTPTGTVQVVAGVWSGAITAWETGTNVFLRAFDGLGHIAVGNLFEVASSSDMDGDGLPDAWEQRFFGSTAVGSLEDPDGDGVTNLDEFRAGTHPLDAASAARITAVQLVGTEVRLSFTTVLGKAYQVESARRLDAPEWLAVGGPVPGTGASSEVIHPADASAEARFYRVRVLP